MNEQTTHLVQALEAVNKHVPRIILGLVTSDLPPVKQHEIGALLTEFGELVHHHADDQTPPSARDTSRERPDDTGPAPS